VQYNDSHCPGPLPGPKLLILNSISTIGYYRVIELVIKGEENRKKRREKREKGGFTQYMYRNVATALPYCPDA